MFANTSWNEVIGISVSLGIGLLVGAERERRKGEGPSRGAAGLRTFTISALAGSVAHLLGEQWLIAGLLLIIGSLLALSYYRNRDDDPGLTTEIAMLLVLLLGALSMSKPLLAAGIGALLAGLLAARNWMHRFVRNVLSEQELHDLILFLSVALIALPIAPDEFIGPFKAINLFNLATFVLAVMLISGIGHVAIRLLGYRGGMSVAGFVSGFISSTATIYAMGRSARSLPQHADAASAGAILSAVATMIQMVALVFLLSPGLAFRLIAPVIGGALPPIAYAFYAIGRGGEEKTKTQRPSGHAFSLIASISLAAGVAMVTLFCAAMQIWLGEKGVMVAAGVAGFADAHAMISPIIGMIDRSLFSVNFGVASILLAFTTNSLTKAGIAVYAGRKLFAIRILPVLATSVAGAWLGFWIDFLYQA